jgi:NitT/TauT family transport system substrate-binding protein
MRPLTCAIAALLLLCAGSQAAGAQERLNLAYISPNAGSSSVLWIAKDAGLFKKHGLDVNLLYIEGTPKALMSLFAGELHVLAGTGPAVVNAKMRGADATMVMGFEVFLPYYLIANSSVKGVEDLKGKVGANHSAATSADFAMRLGLKSIGIDPDRDVSLRVVGATNLRMITLQQNQAQFTVISNSEREPADKMGFRVLADLASRRIPYPHSGLITSRKILKDRRDAMLRFGRATIEAIHFFKAQKAPTIAILKKYAKVDPIALEPAYNYMKSAIPDAPYPTVEGMRTFINEMGRTQPDILKQDPASFVDASIVKAIEDEGFIKRLGR